MAKKELDTSSTWSIVDGLWSMGIIPNTLRRILFYGPKGTGKSGYLRQFNVQYESLPMFRDQPETDLIGTVALRDGSTTFQLSNILRAAQEGRPIVLDEIDQHSNYMRTYLHALLDDADQARVPLPNGEIITPAKGFCVVATTNAKPEVLPEALLDRFDLVLHANLPSDGVLSHLDSIAERTLLRQAHEKQYPRLWHSPEISARTMVRRSRLIRAGIDSSIATKLVFGDKADSVETALACL